MCKTWLRQEWKLRPPKCINNSDIQQNVLKISNDFVLLHHTFIYLHNGIRLKILIPNLIKVLYDLIKCFFLGEYKAVGQYHVGQFS